MVFRGKKSGKYFQTLTSSKFRILILLGVNVLKIKSLKENINIKWAISFQKSIKIKFHKLMGIIYNMSIQGIYKYICSQQQSKSYRLLNFVTLKSTLMHIHYFKRCVKEVISLRSFRNESLYLFKSLNSPLLQKCNHLLKKDQITLKLN